MKLNLFYKYRLMLAVFLLVFCSSAVFGQLTGTKYIPADYATVASAVNALNTSGAGTGGVTFNIAANYTETIAATISITATGTLANPVIFQKDPATTGANPLITAYTVGVGTPATATQDGIIRFIGSDYITIDGIDVRDNPSNTTNPSTMEYGYGLYKASTSNGCQNITIKNCVITLNNTNNATGTVPMVDGSTGIIVMNALATTATNVMTPVAGGTNSNNKFYTNTIQNCNNGIALMGYAAASPFTLADTNNDVGGSAASTGNTIINYGGAAGATNGASAIRTLAQYALNVSYNTINNNNGGGTNHPAILRGLLIGLATSASETITYNIITVNGGGTTQALSGIENAAGSTAAANTINISNNAITNCTYTTATTGGFNGILNSATSATLTINANTISNNSNTATVSGFLYGVYNTGAASTVSISNNIFSGNSTAALTTGLFAGIWNAAASPNVSINSNTLAGNSTTSLSGAYYAIYNTGAVTTTLNINGNNIGNGTTGAFTFNAANSGSQIFINSTLAASASALSISNNNFQGINYAVQGAGANTYISNTAPTKSQAINNNTFTGLNVNTTGTITFIANSVVVPAAGTQNVNSNSIVGSFTKAGTGGTVTLFTSAATSLAGSITNNNSNNFSNITVSGTTVIAGWINTDAGSFTKKIQNNIFSNWAGGTGAITGMAINLTGTNNATSGNTISNISGAGSITGINTAAGNDSIYSNTINGLASIGAAAVTGISISSGTSKFIFGNKIYDLSNSNAAGTVYGISASGSTSAVITGNIYNNIIGDLRTPAGNATDPVRGISITSTRASSAINIFNNTIYLNATSTGVAFGTSGIYHTANATTTAALTLRNNIIVNTSVANGTGFTVDYRRSSTTLNNYTASSNNNIFYAGAPGTTRLIFYDGTNADQTIAAYKTRVATRDAQSYTEDLLTGSKFLSTTGSSSNYLHLDPTKVTLAESGAINIAGFTTDFDGQTRQGNPGYAGSGSAPDIGADEFAGTAATALSGTYNVGAGQTYTSLTSADGLFAAINSLGLGGNVTVNITSDLTEDGTNTLYQWTESGIGNYNLTIQPDASTARLISGDVISGLIRFNGADRVIIDGSNGTSNKYLTFRNTNTAGTTGTAFTFINGATSNTLRYCNIESYANATNGVVLFGTSTVSGGNSSNTIQNSNINATVGSSTGNICIYSLGTVGNENASNSILNNNIYNYRDRALDIPATGSKGWTISGNSFYNGDVAAAINYAAASTLHGIRILGGTGYQVLNNYFGGNAASAGGTSAAYTSTLGNVSFQGIMLTTSAATPVSNIKGNTIANITLSSVPTATSAIAFAGIETAGSGINIGGVLASEGNLIGSNSINSSINITTATGTSTFTTTIRGISCGSTGGLVIKNQVGGIDIKNIGAAPAPSTFVGINISNATAPSQVNSNIIGSTGAGAASNSIRVLAASTAVKTAVTGIAIASTVTSAVQVDGNIIQNLSHLGTVTTASAGGVIGISNASTGASAISITNNTITLCTFSTYSTGVFYGIYNSGACASVSINTNNINGNTTPSATGVYYAIYNAAAVTTAININSNNIGNSTTGAFTFTVANSGAQIFINNIAGAATAALSISNNNFQGIIYSAAGTGSNTYILNSASTLSQTINGNTFTNLNISTTGGVTFISNNAIVPANGTQNVNSNSISGTFNKTGAGGIVTLFTSSASSAANAVINNNSNNFSNITVTGSTTIAGWVNTDAGSAAKTIQNNTFSNWTCGTGAVTCMSVNVSATNNATTGNFINNISSASTITGISTGAGNDNIYSNTINTLSSSGVSSIVTGIAVTAGTTKNIYKNKIYDLSASIFTGSVNGIVVSGGTTVNVYNNLVGDLRTPAASSANDAIRGISVTSTVVNSTINVYYNTVYLNASSTGTTFSSSGIYHAASATATTATLNLRNNSITNTSTPKGTGVTTAYRRSAATLTNYASTSNNNLFYAGTASATRLIFYDGTNADQTLAAFKTRVAARDAQSVTENLTAKFLSTTGSSALFLHMDATQPTQLESGAANIAGFTDDFDAQVRFGNAGYIGSGTAPDIGADEVFGIESVPPVITYTALTNTTAVVNRDITGISITDASGINNNAGTKPRIYYKRFSDANAWLDNTSTTNGWKYTEATNSTSPYTFTINYSLLYGGPAVTAGVIQYFIVAQDLSTVTNIAINSGTFNTAPTSVALTATAFPVTGTINSYNIPFSGTYNIGTGEVFTSLTKADGLFASINSVGMMGNTVFNIVSDITEDGTNALNQWTESGAGNYTATIQPDGATLRTVSGNVIAGLIRLNGADRLTIDGRNGGSGSYLAFKNTNIAGTTGTAFTFTNAATNNAIQYCNVEAYANATNGVMLFGTSAVAGGNSNNIIDNCDINATVASNTGNVAIYSAGTVGNENAGNTISNNNILNYRDRAIDITATGSTGFTISNNNLYNGSVTGAINYAAAPALHGIRILGGTGYNLVNNFIGGNTSQASGTKAVYASTLGNLSYVGILLTTSAASPASSIKGNTIANIAVSAVPTAANSNVFIGIETNGSGINIGGTLIGEGNTIGSNTTNSSISLTTTTTSATFTSNITGIFCASSGGSVIANQVGSIDIKNTGTTPAAAAFTGIYVNNATAPSQVNNNIIGSAGTGAASNSISVLSSSTAIQTSLTGIYLGPLSASAIEINNNSIQNISNLSTTSSGSFNGINNLSVSSAVVTITNNTINNILTAANANAASTIYSGIASSSASAISNNTISNISLLSSGSNAQIMGINVSGAFATTISGNVISGFSTASTKALANIETGNPAGSAIIGVFNSTTAAGQVINNNRCAAFSATSNAAVNVVVMGFAMTSTGSGNIFNNRFGTMINLATGAAPALCHIMAASGSFNVYNNTLRIGNLLNTNSVKIYGIVHASANAWNYYHNTIKVTGNTGGASLRSAAFLLSGNSSPVLENNILFNIRTGTGANYSISNISSPPSNWVTNTCDYNDFYTINANTVAEWGIGVNKTFTQLQSLTGNAHSINSPISFIITPYDLEPDSVTNCLFNDAGVPITTPVLINTDINNIPRSTSNPDMGAYEFHYTGFSIIAGSNSPVCSGDSLLLTVNPGNAQSPSYSWTNPSNVVISTSQHPTVPLISGQYIVTVTDSTGCYVTDSILVSINQRPTATITAQSSLCDSGFVNLNIAVTGTGVINGTLSNGDTFSGTAPLIVVPVFVTTTTSFSITDLTDGSCTAIPADVPDTVTIEVTHAGDWLGITSNWNDPVNWCEGIIPTSATDVTIPAGTSIMPIITGTANCNSITIETGDTLTIAGTGTLNIGGTLTNFGSYVDNGTTNFNGTSGQQTFSGVTIFNNLTLSNSSSLLLPVAIIVKNNLTISSGTLNANNLNIAIKGNWVNNVSTTAFTAGSGTVTFNGTTAQAIGGTFATGFNNLTLANTAAAVSLNVNSSIGDNLSVTNGTFDLAGFTANRTTAGGTLLVANNATLKIGATNTYPVNYTTNTLVVASTVEYAGTNQTVANQLYGNLKLSSAAGAAVKTFPATALTVVGNFSSILGAGTSVSFTAASNITINGNVSIGASTTFNGGSYSHNIGGNWVNSGIFNGNSSTITFIHPGITVSGSGTQNFNNLTIAASGISFATGNISLTGNLSTIGSGSFTQAAGGTLLMTGSGTTISGTGISINDLTVSGTVTTASSLDIKGNLSLSGSFTASTGTITVSGVSKTISGTGSINFSALYVTGSITTVANFSISSGITVSGVLTATAGTATFNGTSSLSGTANLFNVIINGTRLQLGNNAELGIANVFTITSGILDATTSGPNTVNFNGTGNQHINSLTYSDLVLSNGNTKTADGDITTAFDIIIGTGTTLDLLSYTYTTYGNWINNGTFIPGASTIMFVGPANAVIRGNTIFNILTINTTNSSTVLLLENNISVDTLNMVRGVILTGADTLTITGTRTGNDFVRGHIQRSHAFTTGVAYAFEGPNNTITFSSISSVTSITVSVVEDDINDFPFGASINREYNIDVPTGTYNATLRLHYEDDELNGNDESTMALWNYSGSAWATAGKTANSITANYVELSGITDLTNRWTCSDDANVLAWNGSVSTDWHNPANWTTVQGAPSAIPSASDIANLGTVAFTFQPTISDSEATNTIHFGSIQAVTLTIASGGSLTTNGNIDGDWNGNAKHIINVKDQNLTVNGDLDLGEATSTESIDLNIGSGTVTVLGSLFQTGGANVTFTGTGSLNIYSDFDYESGIFSAGNGTVFYDGSENQQIAHVNYNTLTINKTGGIATIDSMVNIAGDLLISAGQLDNFATTTITGNVGIAAGAELQNNNILHVRGNWNNSGTFTDLGVNMVFDGTDTQTISASTFNNLEFNKPVGSLAVLSGAVTIQGNLLGRSGTLDIENYFFNRNVVGGSATMTDSATLIIGADNAPNKFANYSMAPNSTVIFKGTGTQHLLLPGMVYGNIIFRNTGTKILYTPTTVNGNLTIESGAIFDGGSNVITLNGNWINNGTFTPSTSTLICNGTGKTLSGNTTFNKLTVTGSYTAMNDITFNGLFNVTTTGSFFAGTSRTITHNGDITNNGVVNIGGSVIFTGNILQTIASINGTTFVGLSIFNGFVSPIFNSTSSPQFGNLIINNTGGIYANVGWTVINSLVIGSGASFNGGNSTHTIMGTLTNNGTITSSGTLNFIPSIARTVNLGNNFSSTGRVVFGGTGAMTLAGTPVSFNDVVVSNTNASGITPSSNWNISNSLGINAGSILNTGNYIYSVGGHLLNLGTINNFTSTFIINGNGTQDIYGLSAFNNLTINKTAGLTTLSSNATVSGVLNFVTGKIQTGNNLLIQPSTGTVTGAAQNTGWVNGKLQKYIATGATVKTFETGDDAKYTPVLIEFSNVSTAGDLIAFTTAGDHPNLSSSTINTAASVNRYWTLTNNGIGFTNYAATFNFVAADIDAGANTAAFDAGLYNSAAWTMPVTASPNATNIKATLVTTFGDFAIGEVCYKGTAISYPASPYCSNAGTANVTLTGSGGGTYSSTAGLSVNASTGSINLSSGTAGSYVVTYTIAAAGGCRVYVTTANIIISEAASVTISYTGSPYCSSGGTVSVTHTGTTGGVYSAAAGLSIDANSGDINTGTSIPGTYMVAYTIAANRGCGQYQVTTNVTISTPSSATISYIASPYCSNAGTATVTRTGTTGGVYSAAAGLSINATTGAITAATSVPGTYIVTYTIAAANGCGQFSTTTAVTITAMPSATISYNGSPFCNLPGIASANFTGTDGGTFSSAAGLSIDPATGDINTGTSTPGTYTVTYTVDAAEGCGQFVTTTGITIVVSGTWTGTVSNDWNTGENWLCGAVPVATTNVTIPGSLSNYPVISTGISAIHNLIIQAGGSLTVSDGIIEIGGSINNSGTFTADNGTIEMNGTTAQIIPAATFSGNNIRALTINNNAGVTLGGTINLTDVLTVTNGSLASGGFLILKSSATATARVAPITSTAATPISGNVSVERYVPGRRKYRLITSPVTTSTSAVLTPGQESMSIWGNWQNSGINTTANVGELITGGSVADGFDQGTTNASLYTYDDVNRVFKGHTTANGKNTKYTPLNAGTAYLMFVYGDRQNTVFATNPHNTVLNAFGTLKTGDQAYNTGSAIPLSGVTGRFTLLGNPFASPIDWTTLPKNNIANTYWGWDPNLSSTGGYITVTNVGGVTIQAPYSGNTGLNQYIQSGQGFFVKTIAASPTLTIREQDKVSNFNANAYRNLTAGTIPLLAVNLQYTGSGVTTLADGVLALFDASFTNIPTDEDATKMANIAESLSILNTATQLSIDARKMPQTKDTLFLNVARLTKPQYNLQIFSEELAGNGVVAFLQDSYLNTTQPLSLTDTNNIVVNINTSIPASFDVNRFRIVFEKPTIILPLKFVSIKASLKNKDIQVDWSVAEEVNVQKYEVERSTDGISFIKVGEVAARGNNTSENYNWLDIHAATGNNFYRVRSIDIDGKSLLSKVVVVKIGAGNSAFKIFPNPVTNHQVNIHADEMAKGNYDIMIYNQQGQQIMQHRIGHTGGRFDQIITLNALLPVGIYYVKITGETEKYNLTIFIK